MVQKCVIIADPGIDTAFAIALALHDPNLDVLGLIATAGNVTAGQATQNVHVLINQIDPPRWPRLGAALPVSYEINGTKLHGPDGLGGLDLPPITLHHPTPGDKLLAELVRAHPKEVAVILLGPATLLATASERDPELPQLVETVQHLEHLKLIGLMTLPPFFEDPKQARPYFRRLRELRDELANKGAFGERRGELSMGMTNDFAVAIEEGATMVRIGTAIFGERHAGN